jgi:phosphoglycerate kinase
MRTKTIGDLSPEVLLGKQVLLRVDFNVPLGPQGRITDDTRVTRALPTLETLLEKDPRLVVMSHMGRPKGNPDPSLSLSVVADHLATLLDAPVRFVPDLDGSAAGAAAEDLKPGEVLMLENTRFHPGETENDPQLSGRLARYGDVFVNDAFGAAHRAHASTVGVAEAVRAKGGAAVAGLLMDLELRYLGRALEDPGRPFLALLGGAKISGKLDLIHSLLPRIDRLLVGGAMANTFFRAMGLHVGESLVEAGRLAEARDTLEEAGDRILLPVDCVVADEVAEAAQTRVVDRSQVQAGDRIVDIGPATRELFSEELARASTVVWNGPMGVFEVRPFHEGTLAMARAVAQVTRRGGVSVVGGGDSASAAEAAGVADDLSHISTGGGASLELLAGRVLPGVAALDQTDEEVR